MVNIVIIGSGNVAHHLVEAFKIHEKLTVVQVICRNPKKMHGVIDAKLITNQYDEIINADIYIIAVSDDAIYEVAENLKLNDKLIVHTSGSKNLSDLGNQNRKGVFYPLQSFTKSKNINFKTIPICIEATSEKDYAILYNIANSISDYVYEINSEQRKMLHLAAVFANNFTNHMFKIANDICDSNNIPFEILKPLIKETSEKILTVSPNDAQTGPAVRKDLATINTQLSLLETENQKAIYKLLTQSIQSNV